MGLIARALEMEGVSSTLTSWKPEFTEQILPPRATFTRLPRGATLGHPGDLEQQRRVLEATLSLLDRDAPLDPVWLEED